MAGSSDGAASLTSTGRAARLARRVHSDQQDRYGRPMIEHVQRVAETVPTSARAVAFVHDVAERSDHDPGEVALLVGLDDDEYGALELLTKRDGETLLDHTRRVLDAPRGGARELALTIKRADVEDHARRTATPDRVYGQARRLLETA